MTDALRDRVHVFPRNEDMESGNATAELRGDLLILSFTKKHRIVTKYFSIQGASYVLKCRLASRRFIWTLSLALLFLLLGLFTAILFPESLRLPIAGSIVAISLLMVVLSPFTLLFPLRTAQLFFNGPDAVKKVTVKYVPGQTPLLDALLERISPLQSKEPTHVPGRLTFIRSDWLSAFPLRHIAARTGFIYLGLFIAAHITEQILNWQNVEVDLPGWTAWLVFVPFLCIVLYTLVQVLEGTGIWSQRAVRRTAVKALADGDFDGGRKALLEILKTAPSDVEARLLLAHACITIGRYDDALGCLAQMPDEGVEAAQEMALQLYDIRATETGW